jgi:hypothetical protein
VIAAMMVAIARHSLSVSCASGRKEALLHYTVGSAGGGMKKRRKKICLQSRTPREYGAESKRRVDSCRLSVVRKKGRTCGKSKHAVRAANPPPMGGGGCVFENAWHSGHCGHTGKIPREICVFSSVPQSANWQCGSGRAKPVWPGGQRLMPKSGNDESRNADDELCADLVRRRGAKVF